MAVRLVHEHLAGREHAVRQTHAASSQTNAAST